MKSIRFAAAALTAAVYICMPARLANAQITQWVRIMTDPANTPLGRESAAMAYDSRRGLIVMHGGSPSRYGTALSDTWTWDGQTWRLVSTNGPDVKGAGMAYDAARDRMVLYGGRKGDDQAGNINTNELWEFDGSLWEKIESGADVPASHPAMAYDPQLGMVIRHGGITSDDYVVPDAATYGWDGTNWTAIAQGSFYRGLHKAAYDSVRRTTVMYGGGSDTNLPLTSPQAGVDEETREFDGAEWIQVAASGPPPRALHGLTFDSHRGVTILYGGMDLSTSFTDTWEWNGVQWTKVEISGPPETSVSPAMAFDPKRHKVVLFGGSRVLHQGYYNQTWEYGLLPLRLNGAACQADGSIEISWTGEASPYQLQSRTNLSDGDWQNEGEPTDAQNATLPAEGSAQFFRVVSLFGNEQQQ